MKKKSLIILLCMALTIGSVAFGTIAYLTDRQSVANKFTVGNIIIAVDESKVNENGEYVDKDGNVVDKENAERNEPGKGNTYHLIPGKSYPKDPTMTVFKSSEGCYVRMAVTVNCAAELAEICADMTAKDPAAYPFGLPQDHVDGFEPEIWVYEKTIENKENNTATFVFRYHKTVVSTDGDAVLEPIFTAIKVPDMISGEQLAKLAGFEIIVEGQAIQAAVFENADEAWNAFDEQYAL